MGGVVSAGVDNDELVDKLKGADYIKSPNIEKVFRLVDRGYYLTKDNQNVAYRDNAWRSGNLHISAPCIYAQVMEGLQLAPGMSFLNLGSGTGYLSTMAGLLIGPYGINHGVELHSDVIAYARDRLSWFESNTGSIYVMAFSAPEFVQGNALSLADDTGTYDRVYCGASCPMSHENYMKSLLKVGGILVMPRNDQLLKITRTGMNNWSSDSLLPVSFSSLVMPDYTYPPENVYLPSIKLRSLQEKSREVIRSQLRLTIEQENQDLLNAFKHSIPVDPEPRKGQRYYCRVRRTIHGLPFSDPEDDSEPSDGQEEERETLYDAQRRTANQITAFLEFARNIAMNGNMSEEELISALEEERTSEEEPNHDMAKTEAESELVGDAEMDVDTVEADDKCDEENIKEIHENVNEMTHSEVPESQSILPKESKLDSCPADNTVLPTSDKIDNDAKCNVTRQSDPEVASSTSSSNDSPTISNGKGIKEEKTSGQYPSANGRCYTKANNSSRRESKKREKFDSGIGEEDIDRVSLDEDDTTSSTSTPSTSCSPYSFPSYSDNEYSEGCEGGDDVYMPGLPPCTKKHGPGSKCRNCEPNIAWKKKWKKQEMKRRKERKTLKYKKEMRDDSQDPIQKYSTLMVENIKKLPLPTSLKVYINFNRPL